MNIARLDKFTETHAVKLCKLFDLQWLDSSEDTVSCPDFLSTLLEKKNFFDAIHFLACGLPKREAIWWSCVCIRLLCTELSLSELSMLDTVEAWVRSPSEDAQYKTEHMNEVLKYLSPVGWSAQAVFWSGDSLVARDQPKVAPAPQLTAKAVNGAVQLAVVQQPEKIEQRAMECIRRGVDIANGGNGKYK